MHREFILCAFFVYCRNKNRHLRQNKPMIKRYFIYGNIGILLEVFWTGIMSFCKKGDLRLTGSTSIIMFFIYGLAVFMEPLFRQLKFQSFIVRGMTYGLMIFSMEFFCGFGLETVHACPWDYSDALYSIGGLIRMDYYPLWIFVGLLYERVYYVQARKIINKN